MTLRTCETCRGGTGGDDTYAAWHVDGRMYSFCKDCHRRIGDSYVWAGGKRHGFPVLFSEEKYTADDFARGLGT